MFFDLHGWALPGDVPEVLDLGEADRGCLKVLCRSFSRGTHNNTYSHNRELSVVSCLILPHPMLTNKKQ